MHDIINDTNAEMKSEPDVEPTGVSEEDLGFLQNMNLTSLVREFEMEAAAASSGEGGAQHLGKDYHDIWIPKFKQSQIYAWFSKFRPHG